MAQEKTSKQRHIEHLETCTGCEYCDLLREVYTECDMCGGWDLIESPEWKIIDGINNIGHLIDDGGDLKQQLSSLKVALIYVSLLKLAVQDGIA